MDGLIIEVIGRDFQAGQRYEDVIETQRHLELSTFHKAPFMVLRQATVEDYIAYLIAERGADRENIDPEPCARYYEISVD